MTKFFHAIFLVVRFFQRFFVNFRELFTLIDLGYEYSSWMLKSKPDGIVCQSVRVD
jgi:hypothetical protein